jgi:hypothetical protein
MLTGHMPGKSLVSRMHKEVSQFNNKIQTPQLKRKDLKRHFCKEDIQMPNTSSKDTYHHAHQGNANQTATMNQHLPPLRMASGEDKMTGDVGKVKA